MSLDPQGYNYVCDLVRDNSGVILDVGKEYLVEARLRPLAESAGLGTVHMFIERLRATPPGEAHRSVVEAMTTNETSFFRDLSPFEALRKAILPRLIEARGNERQLNIWSAACSTGQEPFTLAIILREYFGELAQWTCRIHATDLARKVIERARAGTYNQAEINRGLPAALMLKYFRRDRLNWVIRDDIREMVDFAEINLTKPWPAMPSMDLILLRNVLIYFNTGAKQFIFKAARKLLKPDGYLLLGNAETTLGVDDSFERLPGDRNGWHQIRK